MDNPVRYSLAVEDFRLARRQAAIQELLARISGRSQRLLPFESIRRLVGQEGVFARGLQEIELDSIVGSVDRYEDFTRSFLPRQEAQKDRWARIRLLAEREGFPPIEVYQVGKVYFVLDGHHRVSVARQLGSTSIQAYVSEVPTKAPLDPSDDADQLIIKAEENRFMKDTRLDKSRPDLRLELTRAGGYRELREHIAVHQYYMGLEEKREISMEEAANHWIDSIYLDSIAAIRRKGLLRDFPDRTEGDLYLWLMEHRTDLAEDIGWELGPEEAAKDLQDRFSLRISKIWKRISNWFIDITTPDTLERGPQVGQWRREKEDSAQVTSLFRRILVAVSGEPRSWRALEQAARIAKREEGQLRGLHVLGADSSPETISEVQTVFDERLAQAEVEGRLVVEKGEVRRVVERRSYWSDLAVLHLAHPPGEKMGERMRSGMRELIQRIPRPLLLVPRYSDMRHALLAFDGSRKSTEALYIAAYMQLKWQIKLTVFTGFKRESRKAGAIEHQNVARAYLEEMNVAAEFHLVMGGVTEGIIGLAQEKSCDLLLMGGYGASPVMEMVLGSVVDQILREFKGPVLICR